MDDINKRFDDLKLEALNCVEEMLSIAKSPAAKSEGWDTEAIIGTLTQVKGDIEET